MSRTCPPMLPTHKMVGPLENSSAIAENFQRKRDFSRRILFVVCIIRIIVENFRGETVFLRKPKIIIFSHSVILKTCLPNFIGPNLQRASYEILILSGNVNCIWYVWLIILFVSCVSYIKTSCCSYIYQVLGFFFWIWIKWWWWPFLEKIVSNANKEQ